jgi:hypothetical protein
VNRFDDTMHRVLARHLRRAVTIRTSSSLSTDPALTVGVVTIKIVTEEQVQAIAFGRLGSEPQVIVRLDPIGRDVSDLAPFAAFMDQTATAAIAAGGALRVWVPHAATLEALDVLGHRYWQNQKAPSEVRRMGEVCRIIAYEATIPGQQVVADASAMLKAHVMTGLAPIEEGHLDAQLAWCDPAVRDPVTEARERIRLPVSGVLPNTPDRPWDDRVDRLRKEAKGASASRRTTLQAEIADLLRQAVLREWRLLIEGRRAFLNLGLPGSGLEDLVRDSSKRMTEAFTTGHFPARQPHRLATELAQMEAGLEKTALVALEADPEVRAQSRRAGAVVAGVVSEVRQTRPGSNPCTILVDSEQGVIRFRPDDKVKVIGVNVTGIVRELSAAPGGGTRVEIEITSGVKQKATLTAGAQLEVTRQGYGFVNHRAFNAIRERQPWIFYGEAPPAISAVAGDGRSAVSVAAEARRS